MNRHLTLCLAATLGLAIESSAAITNTAECGATQDQGSSLDLSGCPIVNGDTGIVLVTIREDTPIRTVSSVTDGASTWVFGGAVTQGTIRTELWHTAVNGVAVSVGPTVTLSGAACGSWVATVATYDGVLGLGTIATNSGNSAAPSISIATHDSNNFIIGQLGSIAVTTGVTSGNMLGNSEKTDGTSPCVVVREVTLDNTSGPPSTLTLSITSASSDDWAAAAMELRTIAVTDTETATATAASTSTATRTATATATRTASATPTSTPSLTPTPALWDGEYPYGAPGGIQNLMRLFELDRSGPYAWGVADVFTVNETPQPYWTPDPFRRAVCIGNYDAAWPLQYNTGPFLPGKGFRVQPLDSQCLIRFTGATGAIWLASPAGVASMEAGLWAQPD